MASPRGISGLIHNFVWVWATEWVFFVTEVIGVYALVYTIGKIDAKTHLKLTWLFAVASLETLLLIVGILSFMMWPGEERWFRTGSVLDAFYNLNIFAQMSMRAAFMCVAAAVVGSIVVTGVKEEERRSRSAVSSRRWDSSDWLRSSLSSSGTSKRCLLRRKSSWRPGCPPTRRSC